MTKYGAPPGAQTVTWSAENRREVACACARGAERGAEGEAGTEKETQQRARGSEGHGPTGVMRVCVCACVCVFVHEGQSRGRTAFCEQPFRGRRARHLPTPGGSACLLLESLQNVIQPPGTKTRARWGSKLLLERRRNAVPPPSISPRTGWGQRGAIGMPTERSAATRVLRAHQRRGPSRRVRRRGASDRLLAATLVTACSCNPCG